MEPLIILLACFALILLIDRFGFRNRLTLSFKGRSALAVMMLFTGAAHFFMTEEMIQMLPEFIGMKKLVIYATGIIEIAASVGLIIPKLSKLTSILLVIFFLAVLPANIIGSIKQVNMGGMEKGVNYLYFRIPLQLFFIFWAYYFGVMKQTAANRR